MSFFTAAWTADIFSMYTVHSSDRTSYTYIWGIIVSLLFVRRTRNVFLLRLPAGELFFFDETANTKSPAVSFSPHRVFFIQHFHWTYLYTYTYE